MRRDQLSSLPVRARLHPGKGLESDAFDVTDEQRDTLTAMFHSPVDWPLLVELKDQLMAVLYLRLRHSTDSDMVLALRSQMEILDEWFARVENTVKGVEGART